MSDLNELARETLILSRNTLLVNLRFLDMALSQFNMQSNSITIATDGANLYYNPIYVLKRFQKSKEEITHDYLHIVMHCVFRHMFIGKLLDERLWDISCDIAVENVITDFNLKSVKTAKEQQQQVIISNLANKITNLTAEKIYRYLLDNRISEEELKKLEDAFVRDEHSIWHKQEKRDFQSEQTKEKDNPNNKKTSSKQKGQSKGDTSNNIEQSDDFLINKKELEQTWKDISERMQQEMETFAKQQGDVARNMMQNLREINRERYDYTVFLRKFAVNTEVMKINNDEFDYIFYTYGLNLYERMPLIEPLEYKDAKRIREFVIAIDTSGSVQGELVQKFIQKTYNILKSTETFASKINLHILQCDADIQEHVKITCQVEFDKYLQTMQIRGLGGTDFRPVFELTDKLIKDKEFTNLKGLIYFTDGFGKFPNKKPEYETAFAFIDNEYNNYNVPPWAIKLVLREEDI